MAGNERFSWIQNDITKWNAFREETENEAINFLNLNESNTPIREIVWSEIFQKLININVDFTGADLQGANLNDAMLGLYSRLIRVLKEKEISSADLSELRPGRVNFQNANLKRANLIGANLYGANLVGADLSDANLSNANLKEAFLDEAVLINTNLTHADLSMASLRRAKLSGLPEWIMLQNKEIVGKYKPHLMGTILNGVDFTGAILNGLDFRDANLSKTKKFSKAKLVKADLSKARLNRANLREADLRQANLNEANLTGAHVNKINYSKAYPKKIFGSLSKFAAEAHEAADIRDTTLTNAILIGVDLSWMDLTNTKLAGANLTDANLTGTNLSKKDLQRVILCRADLSNSILVQTDLRGSTVTGCRVHGIAVWDVNLEGAVQSDLVISPKKQATITIQNLQMAQFIYLLLNRKNLTDIIDTVTSKVVLILGRFTPERKSILDAMGNELRKHNLIPIIFDFDRPTSRDFTETIKTLAGISLFIIVDITKPKSSPLELQAIAPDYQIPILPIIQEGEDRFSMLKDLIGKYDWVLPELRYSSVEKLLATFKPAILDRAWQKHQELVRKKATVIETQSVDDYLKDGKINHT